jgi:hypothetical protein
MRYVSQLLFRENKKWMWLSSDIMFVCSCKITLLVIKNVKCGRSSGFQNYNSRDCMNEEFLSREWRVRESRKSDYECKLTVYLKLVSHKIYAAIFHEIINNMKIFFGGEKDLWLKSKEADFSNFDMGWKEAFVMFMAFMEC